MKIAVAIFAAIVLVVALAIGGWQLGWWMKGSATERRAQINQNTYGRQNALVEQVLNDLKEAQTAGIPESQRIAIVGQLCDAAAKLNGTIALPNYAATFVAQNCGGNQ